VGWFASGFAMAGTGAAAEEATRAEGEVYPSVTEVSEPGQLRGLHVHGQVAEPGRALQGAGGQQRHVLHVRHRVAAAAAFWV